MSFHEKTGDGGPLTDWAPTAHMTCVRCGQGELAEQAISTAFWRRGGLAVIRGIPAMVCRTCGEEYIGDATALALDRLRGSGLDDSQAATRIEVPVFDFAAGPGKAPRR